MPITNKGWGRNSTNEESHIGTAEKEVTASVLRYSVCIPRDAAIFLIAQAIIITVMSSAIKNTAALEIQSKMFA